MVVKSVTIKHTPRKTYKEMLADFKAKGGKVKIKFPRVPPGQTINKISGPKLRAIPGVKAQTCGDTKGNVATLNYIQPPKVQHKTDNNKMHTPGLAQKKAAVNAQVQGIMNNPGR